MNTFSAVLSLCLSFFFASMAMAFEKDFTSYFSELSVGADVSSYRYVEPGLISHEGILFTGFAELPWTAWEVENQLRVSLGFGILNYDGALCDVNKSICSDYKAKTIDLITKIGNRTYLTVNDNFKLFLGLGYRYLFDRGYGTGFYTRTGTYLYAPVGLVLTHNEYVFDAEANFFIFGQMQSNLSEANSTYGDVLHKQQAGVGYTLTASRKIEFWGRQPLASLYFESWNIDKSDIVELYINGAPSGKFFIEPSNYTQIFGVKLSLNY